MSNLSKFNDLPDAVRTEIESIECVQFKGLKI